MLLITCLDLTVNKTQTYNFDYLNSIHDLLAFFSQMPHLKSIKNFLLSQPDEETDFMQGYLNGKSEEGRNLLIERMSMIEAFPYIYYN
jgi:hypothetical protein